MKTYYNTYAECEKRLNEMSKEEQKKSGPLTVEGFYQNRDTNYGWHTRIVTKSNLPIRILSTNMNGAEGACIVALVKIYGNEESVVTYDKYGYPCGEFFGDKNLVLSSYTYYFEDGDYVAKSDNEFGILESHVHCNYRYTHNKYRDTDNFGWFSDQPVRLCTDEERQIIDGRLKMITEKYGVTDEEYSKLKVGDMVYTKLYGTYGKNCIDNLSKYYEYEILEKNGDVLRVVNKHNDEFTISKSDIICPFKYLD